MPSRLFPVIYCESSIPSHLFPSPLRRIDKCRARRGPRSLQRERERERRGEENRERERERERDQQTARERGEGEERERQREREGERKRRESAGRGREGGREGREGWRTERERERERAKGQYVRAETGGVGHADLQLHCTRSNTAAGAPAGTASSTYPPSAPGPGRARPECA